MTGKPSFLPFDGGQRVSAGTPAGFVAAGELGADPAWILGNVMDARPAADFERAHLAAAVSVPLERFHPMLLPPRHEPLLVFAETPQRAARLATWLRRRGRPLVRACDLGTRDLPGLPVGMVTAGPGARRLWQPPDFLRRHQKLLPPPVVGPVLDLGCGAGRAAVWLAERGYQVTGMDRHRKALEQARELAAAAGVTLDLRRADLALPEQVPAGPWAMVVCLRFLERPLLERLPALLLPQGAAVVRTFRREAGAPGLPAPRHCLEPGELLRLLPPDRFHILVHEEGHDQDGRPAAGIVARKLAGAARAFA